MVCPMSDPEQALKTFEDEILAELFGMKAFTVAVVELAGILYSDLAAASDPDNDTLKTITIIWQKLTSKLANQDIRTGQTRKLDLPGLDL